MSSPEPGAPAASPTAAALRAFVARRMKFLIDEGALAVLEPGRGDAGIFIVGSGGPRDAKAAPVIPQIVLTAEHYGRIARTLGSFSRGGREQSAAAASSRVEGLTMPNLSRCSIVFITTALVAACDVDPEAVERLEGATPGEGAAEVARQELRFGSFSFADPAVGRLVVGGGCTATLIDPQAVVTAAHCVDYRTGAATGTFRIDQSSTVSFTFDVEQVRSFGSGVGDDDVAIVRLSRAVPSNVAVPLGLNEGGIISMHERVTMYGYGCRATLGDSWAGRKQRYDTLYDLTIYSCFGDSGGPLIKTMASGTRVVSKVFSGMSKSWPWDWKAEYGLVYQRARAINDQADIWAGRPVDPPPGGGGGGRPHDPNDPPTHQL